MVDDELNAKLKQVIEMAVFSQMLEMDDHEERTFSSSALYGSIETSENTVEDMDEAFSKGDLQHLVSLCDSLRRFASATGFYEVRECCGNLKERGVMSSGDGSASVGVEVFCLSRIKGGIGTLRDSICFARRAIDSFYKGNVK
ncbi:hypothetical protein N7524_003770 [Penicillium chrysogenum]|nr:hypothetical protein N7524_003770 [Penicillium chrysogenum]